MSHSIFTIGTLARHAGLNAKTIRYYETIGLLPPPRRSEAGYRLYADGDVARLQFVRRAKLLGLSLAEVKQLADYADNRRCHSLQEHLLALVQVRLTEAERRVAELAALRENLCHIRDELSVSVKAARAGQVAAPIGTPCQCLVPAQEACHVE